MRVAPDKSEPLMSILNSEALVRLAPTSLVAVRLATADGAVAAVPDRSMLVSAAPERLTAGPTMKLLYRI